jgi:hypothetical protein
MQKQAKCRSALNHPWHPARGPSTQALLIDYRTVNYREEVIAPAPACTWARLRG